MLHQFLSLSHPSASNINCFSRKKREGVGWGREWERESVGECVCFLVPLPTGFGNSQCQVTIILPTLRLISASSKWRKKKMEKYLFFPEQQRNFLSLNINRHSWSKKGSRVEASFSKDRSKQLQQQLVAIRQKKFCFNFSLASSSV